MFKKVLSILLVVVLMMGLFTALPFYASGKELEIAAVGDGDDYPSAYKNASPDTVVDRWNFYNRECTSFVAWCMESRNGISDFNNTHLTVNGQYYKVYNNIDVVAETGYGTKLGHAKYWGTAFQSMGFAVDSNPSRGSIAWWSSGTYGHVAWVTGVNGNDVDIEEYNGPNSAYRFNSRTINKWSPSGFIHIKDLGPNYVNLGDSFYAFIINTAMWKHLTVEPSINVTIRSEKAAKCPDQVFKFERQSDGSYKIISTANGWCLDVNGASSASGANVSVCGSNDSTAQRWYICGESGQYKLKAKCTDCVLDVADGSSAEGTNVRMWESNNSDAQKFQIWRWDSRPEAANIGDGFTAPILNTKAWITLENNNGNVILNKEDGKSHQLWKFQRNLDGSYTIFSCLDGLCIDLYNFLHADGTNIGMCGSNNTNAQRWYIYYNGSYFEFQSKESGKFFDVAGGSLTSGANIQAYSWNGSDYQRFSIYSGDECKIKSPTLKVEAGTSITDTVFSWNDVYGETGFNLKIWKDKVWEGEAYKIIENADRQTKITLPAGTYQAYVDAYNYYDIKMSNTVSFTVIQDTEPTNPPTTPPTEPPTNPPTEPPTNPPTTPPTEPPTAAVIKLGDVDGDGEVTIIDATCIQRKLASIPTAIFIEEAADADEDGELTIIDATVIQRWLAQLPSNANIGKPIT